MKVGLTGLPIMEYDEMQRSQSSMSVATILSFVGVFLVLVAGFGGIRHSLLAMAALLLGLTWSLGYTTLTVGHLNILSSAFGAVLIGLGINYGIYFIARYLQLRTSPLHGGRIAVGDRRQRGAGDCDQRLVVGHRVFHGRGDRIRRRGRIGPDRRRRHRALFDGGLHGAAGADSPGRRPSHGPAIAAALGLPSLAQAAGEPAAADVDRRDCGHGRVGMGVTRLTYDYNLMHLEPANLESVELEQKLVTETKDSAYFALSMASTPEEVAARKARFLQLPTVERVDEIATRFPSETAEKAADHRADPASLGGPARQAADYSRGLAGETGADALGHRPLMAANLQMANFQRQLQEVRSLLGQLPPAEYYARLSEYQQRVAGDLLGRLQLFRSVANPGAAAARATCPTGW